MLFDFDNKEKNNRSIAAEITSQNFSNEVINTSFEKLVLVDFWAPWCEPCKNLTPLLEKIAAQYKDQLTLCKINVEKEQHLASQLRIQSVPTVYVFSQGQPIDGFMGYLPESKLTQFIERLLKKNNEKDNAIENLFNQAQELFNAGQLHEAYHIYSLILSNNPSEDRAIAGLAKCFAFQGEIEQAKGMLYSLTQEQRNSPETKSLIAILDFYSQIKEIDENIPAAKYYNEALLCIKKNNFEQGIEKLIKSISMDRTWYDEVAKKNLLLLFDALGNDHYLTLNGRKKLSRLLFS